MDELIFLKPEPEKFDKRLLACGIQSETDNHIAWRVEKEHYDRFNSISKEKRNEVLSLWRKGGISIGEVAEKLQISSDVVGDVIYLNIQEVSMLRHESL